MDIRLFSSHYRECSPQRQSEILECLERNLEVPEIDSVCLLLEDTESPLPNHPKLKTRPISHRPSYNDFFAWANELVESDADTSVVTNSDIYFDDSIAALSQKLKPIQCAALARWDVQPDGSTELFDRNDSQDVWVFRGKIRPMASDFLMGVPRCDNRILHELRAAGYEVINPAFSVRAFHLHAGERTEYPHEIQGPRVDPPYAYLWPHNLCSLPATFLHRIRQPIMTLGWKPDWRRVQQTLPMRVWKKLEATLFRK